MLLPGHDIQPATLIIDISTGKIVTVRHGHITRHDFPRLGGDHVHWIDAGDKIVLPGLVEYVAATVRPHRRLLILFVLSVPMSTSTSLVVPIGKVSGREQVPPHQEGLRPSWICPSTLFHRRRLLPISN